MIAAQTTGQDELNEEISEALDSLGQEPSTWDRESAVSGDLMLELEEWLAEVPARETIRNESFTDDEWDQVMKILKQESEEERDMLAAELVVLGKKEGLKARESLEKDHLMTDDTPIENLPIEFDLAVLTMNDPPPPKAPPDKKAAHIETTSLREWFMDLILGDNLSARDIA